MSATQSGDVGELGGGGLGLLAPKTQELVERLSEAIEYAEWAQNAVANCKTKLLNAEYLLERSLMERDLLYRELLGALVAATGGKEAP